MCLNISVCYPGKAGSMRRRLRILTSSPGGDHRQTIEVMLGHEPADRQTLRIGNTCKDNSCMSCPTVKLHRITGLLYEFCLAYGSSLGLRDRCGIEDRLHDISSRHNADQFVLCIHNRYANQVARL